MQYNRKRVKRRFFSRSHIWHLQISSDSYRIRDSYFRTISLSLMVMFLWKATFKTVQKWFPNKECHWIFTLTTSGGARNFFPVGLSPPKRSSSTHTKYYFTYFKNFSGWAQWLVGWAEPTPGAATKYMVEAKQWFRFNGHTKLKVHKDKKNGGEKTFVECGSISCMSCMNVIKIRIENICTQRKYRKENHCSKEKSVLIISGRTHCHRFRITWKIWRDRATCWCFYRNRTIEFRNTTWLR